MQDYINTCGMDLAQDLRLRCVVVLPGLRPSLLGRVARTFFSSAFGPSVRCRDAVSAAITKMASTCTQLTLCMDACFWRPGACNHPLSMIHGWFDGLDGWVPSGRTNERMDGSAADLSICKRKRMDDHLFFVHTTATSAFTARSWRSTWPPWWRWRSRSSSG